MGTVFGKIGVETPKYTILRTCPDYEIRNYSPTIVAEVTYDPTQLRGGRDGGFRILADYIGALGDPRNSASEKIAMTAPVITQFPKMPMPEITASGAGGMVMMSFVLPGKFKGLEEVPRPVDERVVVREVGEKRYGVVRFGGVAEEGVVGERVEKLKGCLERDGYKIVGDYLLARFNPPWTLPMFRTNEIMIPIE